MPDTKQSYDLTILFDTQEVALYPTDDYTKDQSIAHAQNYLDNNHPDRDQLKPVHASDVKEIWVLDNPKFQEKPDEYDAYLYVNPKIDGAYPVWCVPFYYNDQTDTEKPDELR